MRILHVLNTFEEDSLSRLVLSITRGLRTQPYEIHVVALYGSNAMAHDLAASGASVMNLGMRGYHDLGVILRLRDYICDNRINVVHSHILRADLMSALAAALVPGTPLVFTRHNHLQVRGQPLRHLKNAIYCLTCYMPSLVVTVSDELRRCLCAMPGIPRDRIVTIHNGIDVQHYYRPELRQEARVELGVSDDDKLIGYLGRLAPGKGLESLLAAMHDVRQRCPKARLLIYGVGSLQDRLQHMCRALGSASGATLCGVTNDVPRALAALDAVVLPSLSEGLPLTVMEAMSAAKPVIATAVGGIPELVTHEQTGLLIPAADGRQLAQTITRLLTDDQLAADLSARARKYAVTEFGVDRMVKRYDTIYRQLAVPELARLTLG